MAENFAIDIEVEIGTDGTDNGGNFIVLIENGVFDKTWQEIYDALASKKPCYIFEINSDAQQIAVSYVTNIFSITGTGTGDGYYITANTDEYGIPKTKEYKATTANGYPS